MSIRSIVLLAAGIVTGGIAVAGWFWYQALKMWRGF